MSDDTTRGPAQDGTDARPTDGSGTPPAPQPAYGVPPQAASGDAPAYGAPPAPGDGGYGAPSQPAAPTYAPPTGPAYGQAPYGQQPGYPAAAPYGGQGYPQQYTPYPTEPKTNVLSIISLIASIVGFLWIIPFLGSLGGAIMGHLALGQIKKNGEKGRGLALAGIIVGWAGVALFVVGVIIFFSLIAWGATNGARYGS